MVTIFDTSSVETDIDILGLCMYTIKNIWLEKEKYLEKQKKPVSIWYFPLPSILTSTLILVSFVLRDIFPFLDIYF